jgi:hypothetical protein
MAGPVKQLPKQFSKSKRHRAPQPFRKARPTGPELRRDERRPAHPRSHFDSFLGADRLPAFDRFVVLPNRKRVRVHARSNQEMP